VNQVFEKNQKKTILNNIFSYYHLGDNAPSVGPISYGRLRGMSFFLKL